MTQKKQKEQDSRGRFKNRIVGYGEEPVDQILFNPANWRIHPVIQQDALIGVLEEVGWVQNVIVNKRTGNLVDGHLRVQIADKAGQKAIPVTYVDLSENEEMIILAAIDPIGAMATKDKEKQRELVDSLSAESLKLLDFIKSLASELDESVYSKKIEVPIYEPSNFKPELRRLYDKEKFNELIDSIDKASLTQEEKEFLIIAAYRHIVLNFKLIADYYANSGDEMKELMEQSALVIIDFDKAIENGFVEMTGRLGKLYDLECGQ